ncbi:alpha/beta fold hydrolase [Oricola thermophila]|uniref:Alpha/beta hydrolase n=1 Tax=Oricola thermophila TaxID=2742145 RepID=A0A6N1VMG7_9HYPH|nr:alpha/beta hydrolase [Oricola thermophila]QKV20399.1 alpha/beta hydrolase [Oricola thermophila]
MQIVVTAFLVLLALLAALVLFTRIFVLVIERRHPPVGRFATVNGTRLHYVLERAEGTADLPPVVFLHGASGNLLDQMLAFRDRLAGRADLLFVDRPGHGWSARGPEYNELPDGQADTIAALLDELGIGKAIIAGHSFGGAIAASFALNHPGKTAGILFMAPVSHPWPGGVDWYYDLTPRPIIGRLFSETLVVPLGLLRLWPGTRAVFSPNPPARDFVRRTGVAMVLRPWHFRANAIDVARLSEYVARTAPRYPRIKAPAVIITGDGDTIVLPRVHSMGLARDLENAELVWVRNLGHKPDYVATDLAVAALEKLAGKPRDLQALARQLEERIAEDRYGPVHRSLGNREAVPSDA